jgi:hypothetical protein
MRFGARVIELPPEGPCVFEPHRRVVGQTEYVNKSTEILIEVPDADIYGRGGKYPNFYRAIPRNGEICPFSGLKHARLYKLLSEGGNARAHVRVVQLKEPGAAKGVTLFHVGDLMQFLDRLAAEQRSGTCTITSG